MGAFKEIDTNGSGKISELEFDRYHITTNLRMILKEFQESHEPENKMITASEFRNRFYERYVCPVSRTKKLFRILHANKNGKISFDELKAGLEGDQAVNTLL